MDQACTRLYDSPLGRLLMASDGTALTGLWFDDRIRYAVIPDEGRVGTDLPVFDETARWLDIYFSGKAPDFTPEYTYERLGEILKDAPLKSKAGLLDLEGKLYGIAAGYAQDGLRMTKKSGHFRVNGAATLFIRVSIRRS